MNLLSDQLGGHFFSESLITVTIEYYLTGGRGMKWDKREIDKLIGKRNVAFTVSSLGIVRKIKLMHVDTADYQTIGLSQVVTLETERRKAEALTLIRRASFM